MVEILTYHDNQISSSDFDNTFKRIQNLINIVRDAENQDEFMDGQELTQYRSENRQQEIR